MRPDLGESVKEFESGKRGVCEVSTGKNDLGGVSYGTYQLSADKGTAQEFLNSPEGAKFKPAFEGLTPGTGAFSARWKEIASLDPEGLQQAEKAFVYRMHYLPQAKMAAERGFDMDNPAIQDAVWSGAIQHGRKFRNVLDAAAADPNFQTLSDAEKISTLYAARSAFTDGMKNLPQTAGRLRYDREHPVVQRVNEAYQQSRPR